MSTVKIILLGTAAGVILSILSLSSAYAGVILLTGTATIPMVLIVSTLSNGVILGMVSVSLSYLTSGYERTGLILLISLAVASLTVMLGRYDNGSLLPMGIYALAVMNSLLISRVTAVLARHKVTAEDPYIRG